MHLLTQQSVFADILKESLGKEDIPPDNYSWVWYKCTVGELSVGKAVSQSDGLGKAKESEALEELYLLALEEISVHSSKLTLKECCCKGKLKHFIVPQLLCEHQGPFLEESIVH